MVAGTEQTETRGAVRRTRPSACIFASIIGKTLTTVAALTLMAAPAFAQDGSGDSESIDSAQSKGVSGLSFNLPTGPATMVSGVDAFSVDSFDMPSIDLPVDSIGSTLFKLDLSDQNCFSGLSRCEVRTDSPRLGISKYIAARQGDGIDLVLRPRASFRFDDNSSSTMVGAVVEIGEDLRRNSDYKTNTWYLFAGADAEALTYAPDGIRRLSSGQLHLQDRIIVGDAQAGLGYRIGDADVSLSYLRREATAEGISYNEDAAALSFTWKR